MEEFPMITRWLRSEEHSVSNDKKLFEKCLIGEISLQETKRRFIKNNRMPRLMEETMTDEYFTGWLKSIGYEISSIQE